MTARSLTAEFVNGYITLRCRELCNFLNCLEEPEREQYIKMLIYGLCNGLGIQAIQIIEEEGRTVN